MRYQFMTERQPNKRQGRPALEKCTVPQGNSLKKHALYRVLDYICKYESLINRRNRIHWKKIIACFGRKWL